ncbi:hypothetical protein BDK51DRAFT_32646 [Blyttiomyces helicus]|uniref:Uncharacterized protein n=1 Tax=Blyttiomyces helicus TaxID=388810 RepID=A0A4P9W9X0_9FUNG|nr:hypothetical protein BDK51DRAFT_32646 [Blyttiomyces helicus]|eukprot:RKO89361.1 hypothetical protein BDK51DRAFT_32646 [Blyttiomyces helicus]
MPSTPPRRTYKAPRTPRAPKKKQQRITVDYDIDNASRVLFGRGGTPTPPTGPMTRGRALRARRAAAPTQPSPEPSISREGSPTPAPRQKRQRVAAPAGSETPAASSSLSRRAASPDLSPFLSPELRRGIINKAQLGNPGPGGSGDEIATPSRRIVTPTRRIAASSQVSSPAIGADAPTPTTPTRRIATPTSRIAGTSPFSSSVVGAETPTAATTPATALQVEDSGNPRASSLAPLATPAPADAVASPTTAAVKRKPAKQGPSTCSAKKPKGKRRV